MKIKIKETPKIKKLREAGLLEGFLDKIVKAIKNASDKEIEKIAKKRNDKVADFISDFKKNPAKYGY